MPPPPMSILPAAAADDSAKMASTIQRKLSKLSLKRAMGEKSKGGASSNDTGATSCICSRGGSCSSSDSSSYSCQSTQHLFAQLSDDVTVYILSYVSYAPYERPFDDSPSEKDACIFVEGAPDGDCQSQQQDRDRRRLFDEYTKTLRTKEVKDRKQQPASVHPFKSQAYYIEKLQKRSAVPRSKLRLESFGTLTHVLPLVCKRFRDGCSADVLWAEAIERLVASDPNCWGVAIRQYVGDSGSGSTDTVRGVSRGGRDDKANTEYTYSRRETSTEEERPSQGDGSCSVLVSRACAKFRARRSTRTRHSSGNGQGRESIARRVFKRIAREATPHFYQGPLFTSSQLPRIGQAINLRFEPRYRLLIEEVMEGRSIYERSGNPIGHYRPLLLLCYGLMSSAVTGDQIFVAELARCNIDNGNGRTDVTVFPVEHAKAVWKRERRRTELLDVQCRTTPKVQRERVDFKNVTYPAFIMPSSTPPPLGIEYALHVFQPRYMQMIDEITEGVPPAYRGGKPIPCLAGPTGSGESCHRPRFLFAHGQNLAPGEDASVVEVRRFQTKDNIMKEITYIPIQRATVTAVHVRAGVNSLVDATVQILSGVENC